MVRARSVLDHDHLQARVQIARREWCSHPPSGVVLEVSNAAKLASLPYWAQGDAAFYMQGVLEARMALRRDAAVASVLEEWWRTALNSLRAAAAEDRAEGHLLLQKRHYLLVWSRVHKALVGGAPGEGHDGSVAASADAEWELDRKGAAAMTRELFLDAIFEIADHWTPNVGAAEYARFLRELLLQVSFEVPCAESGSGRAAITFGGGAADGLLTGNVGADALSQRALAPLKWPRYFWRDVTTPPPKAPCAPKERQPKPLPQPPTAARTARKPPSPRPLAAAPRRRARYPEPDPKLPPRPVVHGPVWAPTGPAPGMRPRVVRWAGQGCDPRLPRGADLAAGLWKLLREHVLRTFANPRRAAAMARWRRADRFVRHVRRHRAAERRQAELAASWVEGRGAVLSAAGWRPIQQESGTPARSSARPATAEARLEGNSAHIAWKPSAGGWDVSHRCARPATAHDTPLDPRRGRESASNRRAGGSFSSHRWVRVPRETITPDLEVRLGGRRRTV